MRTSFLIMAISLSVFSGQQALGQLTMFEGKVTDDSGMPVRGAIIQLKWKGDMIETRSNDEGSFYTTLIPEGMYRLGVETGGKYYKLRGLKILASSSKKYYYIRMHGERISVDVEGMDPYLKSKYGRR